MRALLDVNVIIALLDPDHVFHERAHVWWASNRKDGWASCPLTENGVVRIMSNPNYSTTAQFPPADLIHRLQQFARNNDHEFWPDTISLRDGNIFDLGRIHSSRLLTDLYLLALVVEHQGRLITFDREIPLSSVRHVKSHHLYAV